MFRLSALFFLLFDLVAVACDVPPDESASNGEWVVSSFPKDGDSDVSRTGSMTVELDRRVYPQSVDRGSVQISSGEIFSWLYVYFEPVTRRIVVGLYPDRPLEPFVTYRLAIQSLVDLDGKIQPETYQLLFRTGSRLEESIPVPAVEWKTVDEILKRSCTHESCHGGSTPALGLDLSSASGIRQTAIGAISNEFPKNMASAEEVRGLFSFSGFRVIDVGVSFGRPASSYLMYKVLGDPHIVGYSMPPRDSNLPRLEREELEALSAWILYGAPTRTEAQ